MAQTVANRLRALRLDRGLSQAELAARTHVTRQTINSIEAGKYTPATELSLRLAAVLGCRVEDIFRLADESVKVACFSQDRLRPGDRVVAGRVGERVIAHRLAGPRMAPDGFVPADAVATRDGVSLLVPESQLSRTALIAGCDPSLSILSAFVARKSPEHRVVPLHSPSEAALRELADGVVHVAGSHLPGRRSGEQNISQAKRALARSGGLVVTYASWEQGIVVAAGNPKGIRSLADVARPGVSIVNRDRGSGSRALLNAGLAAAGIDPHTVRGYATSVATHMAVARSVQVGAADAGIALRAVARTFDLDFIPLAELRFDLVIPGEHLEHSGVRLMLDVLQSRAFRADLAALPGYEVSRTGTTILELKAA